MLNLLTTSDLHMLIKRTFLTRMTVLMVEVWESKKWFHTVAQSVKYGVSEQQYLKSLIADTTLITLLVLITFCVCLSYGFVPDHCILLPQHLLHFHQTDCTGY